MTDDTQLISSEDGKSKIPSTLVLEPSVPGIQFDGKILPTKGHSLPMVGAMQWCGDVECNCWVPLILGADGLEVWRGRFVERCSEDELQVLRTELLEECRRRGVVVIPDLTYRPNG